MWGKLSASPAALGLANAVWEEPTTLWLVVGLALVLAELLIPQLFVVFLGMGAIAVSGIIYLGWVDSPEAAVGVWVAASAALLWALRDVLMRLAPGERDTENIDEDLVAAGSIVEVISVDRQDPFVGRIQFRGTEWDAWCPDESMQEGMHVRLVARENLRWLVEPAPSLPPSEEPSC